MVKQKFFNYLTIILALITIILAINTCNNDLNPIFCTTMLIITFVISFFSRKFNNENVNLTDKDREFLKNAKYISNDKEVTNNILREKEKINFNILL